MARPTPLFADVAVAQPTLRHVWRSKVSCAPPFNRPPVHSPTQGSVPILVVNADNQAAIARAGGIEPLVALARSGTDGQKEHAAGALRNLGVTF